jgi:flagellar assembly protein FliH
MAEMAKFLFDTVFDDSETALAPVQSRAEKSFWSTDERDAARNEGFERGRQAGIDETLATMEAKTASALETIATNVAALTAQLETQRQQLKQEGIVLANMIARSLTSALIAREPMHEIETLFSEALEFLPDTPHIAVRLNEALLEDAREKLDTVAAERGFQGKLIILGQPDIAHGDCRIEWAKGGIVKDQNLVRQRIFEITNQYIDASLMPAEEKFSDFDRPGTTGQPEETKND